MVEEQAGRKPIEERGGGGNPVWIIDDDRSIRWVFEKALAREGIGFRAFATAREALERLEVDRHGLDVVDRRILSAIVHKFDGGPVGIATLAAAVGEDRGTLEEIYEPYLLQIGFLDRTPRGRRTTRRAHEYLGASPSGGLFPA